MRRDGEGQGALRQPREAGAVRLAVGCGALLLAARLAWACGNPVFYETSKATKLIADAERALERNQPKRAARLFPEWAMIEGPSSSNAKEFPRPDALPSTPLEWRLQLLRATAWLRTERVAMGQAWLVRVKDRPEAQSPEYRARFAEAFVSDGNPERVKEARAIIEHLASKDLVPDAFAWHTLAIARRAAGDAAGAKLADDRCRAVAKVTTICKPRPAI